MYTLMHPQVSVVVLGGSIAMGHGTSGWPERNDMAFGAVTARWLAGAFPMAGVAMHNGAVGATPSGMQALSITLKWATLGHMMIDGCQNLRKSMQWARKSGMSKFWTYLMFGREIH